MLADDDSSTRVKRTREKALAKEARFTAARVRLQAAIVEYATRGVAIHGALAPTVVGAPSVNIDDEDATEKKEQRLLKRKLPSPKDGWNDGKGATIGAFDDKHMLLQYLFDIFWELRGVLKEHVATSPAANKSAESSLGVKRANLPDPEVSEEKLEAMAVCEASELGLN